MRRFAALAFSTLVVATVAAFFVTQHLKVTTPLINGARIGPVVINPYGAVTCGGVDHSRATISFYLLHRSDDISLYVVDADGAIVRTLASGHHMRKGVRHPDGDFSWNGRTDNGQVAPDGTYFLRVALLHQGRTIQIANVAGRPVSIRIKTIPPRPRVTRVTVSGRPPGSAPEISPPGPPVKIEYDGTEHRSAQIQIYRSDLPGRLRLVKRFKTKWGASEANWDGLLAHRQLPPQGNYVVGLRVTDAACNVGKFPSLNPPTPGSTSHAGVSVRYLAAQPPLTATPAGSRATVYVDAHHVRYHWTLWRAGARKPSAHGSQRSYLLAIKLPPARDAGLYHVVIHAAAARTDVPLVADHPGTSHRARVLVVLPAVTWQGANPVDDPPDYDGIPNTLSGGSSVLLARPLVNGLPAGWSDEAGLLAYLDRAHLPYDLTTDVGLITRRGPQLTGRTAVVLAGSERWAPDALSTLLRVFAQNGGRVLSLGTDSLRRSVKVAAGRAFSPSAPAAKDAFGSRLGPLSTNNHELILVIHDGLHLFTGTSGGFSGYGSYQPIHPAASALSSAGVSDASPAIVGYRLGRGVVVQVGLAGFGSSLAGNVDAKELLGRLWTVLRR